MWFSLDSAARGVARGTMAWVLLAAVGATWLAVGLPPQTFYAGDSGLKLIGAREAIRHPDRPFEIDLPLVGGRAGPWLARMFVVHGDHAHLGQSPLFPVLVAPALHAFGMRGAYLLPLIGFVALIPLLEAIRRVAAPHVAPWMVGALAVVASPMLFYALELWEHAPAAALLAASTALALRGRHAAAGAVGGVAALLRPEAALYVAALGALHGAGAVVATGAGAMLVLVPAGLANLMHHGNPLGPHISANLAPLTGDWLAARMQWLRMWLHPGSSAGWTAMLLVACAWLAAPMRLGVPARQVIALAGVLIMGIVAATRALEPQVLWQAFPLVLLAAIPGAGAWASTLLWRLAALSAAAVWLTAAHDGGAQWGPRFLLVVAPVMMVLAGAGAAAALAPGRYRMTRAVLVAAILLAGLATSRAAYRELRGSKEAYARLVDAVEQHTTPAAPIVTNIWWLDQVAASLHGARTFVHVPTPEAASAVLRQAQTDGVAASTLAWTLEPDGAPLEGALQGTCYEAAATHAIPERRVVLRDAVCRR